MCGIVFPTLCQIIETNKTKIAKKTHSQKLMSVVLEHFQDNVFDKYQVADLLNLSPSGAYKFLAVMEKNAMLDYNKTEKNKIVYSIE